MPSEWNMFVKKIYHEGKAKNSSYEFKQALKDGSVRFEMSGRHDATANPTKRYAEVKKLAKGGVRAIYRG